MCIRDSVNDALIKEFLDALNNCEFARFAPGDDNQAIDVYKRQSLIYIGLELYNYFA